ncbi:TatD family hydrolase [Candidatus Saccharibacteria bacterium]|nr:TatD family hydrolase [Candidatus Saccharibacteria bacterium]
MSYLIDSHTHLHDREFFSEKQAAEMLENAKKLNVLQMICIGTNHEDSLNTKKFAAAHENVFWTYGTHPESAENYKIAPEKDEKLVAIGEVGLDYHYEGFDKSAQWKLLEEMIDLAISLELPVSFHVRDALEDFFGIVKNFPKLKPSVLHSFSDSPENLEKALSLGFYVGINGMTTFANLKCYREIGPEILERAVLETDAPFLTPVPKRGKINEPGNVKYVADWLSEKLGVSLEEVSEKTTKNVQQIFHLPNPRNGTCE